MHKTPFWDYIMHNIENILCSLKSNMLYLRLKQKCFEVRLIQFYLNAFQGLMNNKSYIVVLLLF